MKRSELKVGETYAVLAPAQRVKVDSPSSYLRARKVVVFDLSPEWVARTVSYGSGDGTPEVEVLFAGRKVTAKDRTAPVRSYRKDEAGRLVKVLVETSWVDERSYSLEVVPVSHVAMTWAEYEGRRGEAERQDAENRAAQNRLRREREKKAEALRKKTMASGFDGRVRYDASRGEVVLSFESFEQLLGRR